jgi:hypothetical protein
MMHVHDLPICAHPTASTTALTVDPALALDILRRRFPGLCLWFGNSTRHWWAVVDGDLLEAGTPEELGRRIDLAVRDLSIIREGDHRS